jgi:glycosyltransferase involved in cell wall biosynthesis
MEQERIDCSIIVPLYNEEKVVDELYQRLSSVMAQRQLSYELVFVEDGSADGTLEKLKAIAEKDDRVTVVELRRNFGQTPALAAGFDNAKGDILISMDGDLQHMPEEIPQFLEKIEQGYDVVSGWRKKRVDNMIMRKIPSKIANWIASKVSGVEIHDFGTTFKAYRREIIEDVNLYGEMHRFIPALVSAGGANIIEIPIKNIERPAGKSNYGIGRTFRVVFDLLTLRFLLGYATRPLHFFGKAAMWCFVVAGLMAAYIVFDKFYFNVPVFKAHGPLAAMTGLLLLIAFGFVCTGLLGELITRAYYESTGRTIYTVRKIYNNKSQD